MKNKLTTPKTRFEIRVAEGFDWKVLVITPEWINFAAQIHDEIKQAWIKSPGGWMSDEEIRRKQAFTAVRLIMAGVTKDYFMGFITPGYVANILRLVGLHDDAISIRKRGRDFWERQLAAL